jgi:transcription elongation GreA/GreB family factor
LTSPTRPIRPGDTVVIRFPNGRLHTFRLERRPTRPAELSVTSPLGAAVLGRQIGDTARYESAGGLITVQIAAVR